MTGVPFDGEFFGWECNIEPTVRIPRNRELGDAFGDAGTVQQFVPPLLKFRAVCRIGPPQEVVAHQGRPGSTAPTHPSSNSTEAIQPEPTLDDQLVCSPHPIQLGHRAGEIDERPGDVGASEVPLRRHIGRECDTRAVHHDPRQHVSTRITNGDLRSNRYFQGKPEQACGRSVAHNSIR